MNRRLFHLCILLSAFCFSGCSATFTGSTFTAAPASLYELDAAIAAGGPLEIYSTLDHTATNYARSSTCWARSVDLSPVAVFNSSMTWTASKSEIGALLITPQHFISCAHSPITTGEIRFVTPAGVVVSRTVTDYRRDTTSDLHLGKLDAAITNIRPALMLPASWRSLVTTTAAGWPELASVPIIAFNQTAQAHTAALNLCNDSGVASFGFGAFTGGAAAPFPTITNRLSLYLLATNGDSGNALCLVQSNRLVAFSHFWTAGTGPQYGLSSNRGWIETNLAALGGATNLTNAVLPYTPDLYPNPLN